MPETFRNWNMPDEQAVSRFAKDFGNALEAPVVIFLQGDLGAGKTTFARALIQGLGYLGKVKSPTYGLLESYQVGVFDFLHLDLYRIENPAELEFLAIADQFSGNGVLLIEWPEKAGNLLPHPDITLIFKENNSDRSIEAFAKSELGGRILASIPS
jgi:tRNA threonylcarbamoyladenosine biosynthesis protein TsaE